MFVSDKFTITQNTPVVLTNFYTQTTATNLGNKPTNIEHSESGTDWELLTELQANQTQLIKPKKHLRITSDTLVYIQSKSNDFTHTDKKDINAKEIVKLATTIEQKTQDKATTQFVELKISELVQLITQSNEQDSVKIQQLVDRLTALAQADTGLVSVSPQQFTTQQKQQACVNIDAMSMTQASNLIRLSVTPLTNLIDNHTSQLDTLNKLIETKADVSTVQSINTAQNQMNAKFDNLAVGGRNLILNSQVSRTTQGTTALSISQNINYNNLTNLVLSVDVSYKNARKATAQGAKWFRIGAEFRFIYTDNTVKYFGAWAVIQDLSPTTFNGRITNYISVPTDKTIKMIDLAQIQIWDIVADEMLVKNPKLEIGTIPTDWTPAPEDLQVDITNSINSLQIGGKNYFKKSTPLRVIGGGDFQKNSENGVTFTANQATKTLFRLLNVIDSIGVWTVSCYAKATQNARLFVDVNDNGQVQDTGNQYWNEFNVGTEYQKIVATINTSKSNSVYNFVDFSTLSTETFTIKDLKIEKGSIPTDYTQAPEDTQSQIDNLTQRLLALESK